MCDFGVLRSLTGIPNILRSNFKRKREPFQKKEKIPKKFERIIKARNITCQVSLSFFRRCSVAYSPFNAVLATFFGTRIVLLFNWINSEILAELGLTLKIRS